MYAQVVVIEDLKPQSQSMSEYNSARASQIQEIINKHKVDIDFNVFKKNHNEKHNLKLAKLNYSVDPERGRDELLRTFIDSKIPNWNLTFIVK